MGYRHVFFSTLLLSMAHAAVRKNGLTPKATKPRNKPRSCPKPNDICFNFEGLSGGTCESMTFYVRSPWTASAVLTHSLAGEGVNVPGPEFCVSPPCNPLLHPPGAPNYIALAEANVPGCPPVFNRCTLDCALGGRRAGVHRFRSSDPPLCDDPRVQCRASNTSPPPTPPPTPRPTPPPPRRCPSGSDIWFNFEGATGQFCETMYFQLPAPWHASAVYTWSLAGAGNNLPGNNACLSPPCNSLINRPRAGNYIFVAKAKVPGCLEVFNRCTLGCACEGRDRSPSDPLFCDGATENPKPQCPAGGSGGPRM